MDDPLTILLHSMNWTWNGSNTKPFGKFKKKQELFKLRNCNVNKGYQNR